MTTSTADLPPVRTLAPFGVFVDWLTINARAPVSLWAFTTPVPWKWTESAHDTRRLFLVPSEHRTQHFGKVAYLSDAGGEKLVTFVACPYSEALHPPDRVQVQFSNVTLYTASPDDPTRPLWLELWALLQRGGFQYEGTSRLDLAADALAGNGGDFQGVVHDCLFRNAGRYYGAANWMPRFQRSKVAAFELGTRSSNKYLRCYNKARELKRAGHAKRHINDAWAARLGWDPMAEGEDVNRFELQVRGKEVRRYYDDERGPGFLDMLARPQYRVELLASMAVQMFDFRTHAERSRDAQPLAVWDWSGAATPFDMAGRSRRTLALNERTLKVTVRTLYLQHLATGDRKAMDNARELCEAAGPAFVGWWGRARERWRKESCALLNAVYRGQDVGLFDQFTISTGAACQLDREGL